MIDLVTLASFETLVGTDAKLRKMHLKMSAAFKNAIRFGVSFEPDRFIHQPGFTLCNKTGAVISKGKLLEEPKGFMEKETKALEVRIF